VTKAFRTLLEFRCTERRGRHDRASPASERIAAIQTPSASASSLSHNRMTTSISMASAASLSTTVTGAKSPASDVAFARLAFD